MDSLNIEKLCLGTAQFGLDYGIANKKGKLSKDEVFKILTYAHNLGIGILDTAYSYGESEALIGEFISRYGKDFNIISKTPSLNNRALAIEQYCLETLKRLGKAKAYGYLVHKFDDILLYKEDLWKRIESLKQKSLVDKIGVSLYRVEGLEYLLNNRVLFDLIQIPYNIFDQRFKGQLSILKKKSSIEVYARSVFLQGLFFIEREELKKNFSSAKDNLERLRQISREHQIPLYSLCLCFVLLNPFIDKIVIGVDSLEQLKENIDSLKYIDKVRDIYGLLESLKFHDEEIILPFNWRR